VAKATQDSETDPRHHTLTIQKLLTELRDHCRQDMTGTCKSITKVSSTSAPPGRAGQKYLASGIHISMRLWERENSTEAKAATVRDYETVGSVIEGKAELHLEGQMMLWREENRGWCQKVRDTATKSLKHSPQ
jgi:hypothetical protein